LSETSEKPAGNGIEAKVQHSYPTYVSNEDDEAIFDFLEKEKSEERVKKAIEAFRNGGYVAIIEQKKEREADLGFYAGHASNERVGEFMELVRGGGSFCVAFPVSYLESYIKTLETEYARLKVFDPEKPNFVNIVDSDKGGTGWQAPDRALVVADLMAGSFGNIKSLGHSYLLKAHPDGLRGRIGHTESYVDLAKLAGIEVPGVVFQELARYGNEPSTKGVKLWGPELIQFLQDNAIQHVSTRDLIKYERAHPNGLSQLSLA